MFEKFTRDDLKTGMILEQRNGNYVKVFLDTVEGNIYSGKCDWAPLDEYNNDLTRKFDSDLDVMKVYCPKYNSAYGKKDMIDNPKDDCDCKLIWERPMKRIIIFDGKEITISEESYQAFKKQFSD